MKNIHIVFILLFMLSLGAHLAKAQTTTTDEDALFIKSLYDQSLQNGRAYDWLKGLTKDIGPRLAGSPNAQAAVTYTYDMLDTLGLDSVWLQPCTVPHWVRGAKEVVRVTQSTAGSFDLHALALGNSSGSGSPGVQGEIVEVLSLEALEKLGTSVKGKIVFFNRPFDNTQLNTFSAYGGAVDQRGLGADKAKALGAIGVIVRSMTGNKDDVPHTGGMRFTAGEKSIPAVAIATNDADRLHDLLLAGSVKVYIETHCRFLSPKPSYNVIGEIKGRVSSDTVILVGGHLDSWDIGEGAHDDGAGCVHSMEVLRLLKLSGYQPRYTIRCVLFMNEENGLAGGKAYSDYAIAENVFHLAAIESDRGGFTPRGFTVEADPSVFTDYYGALTQFNPILEGLDLRLRKGGAGADISDLKVQKGVLIGFEPDSQRYFDYHHTAADTLEAVHWRELQMGAAAMSALVFLIDKYGL